MIFVSIFNREWLDHREVLDVLDGIADPDAGRDDEDAKAQPEPAVIDAERHADTS